MSAANVNTFRLPFEMIVTIDPPTNPPKAGTKDFSSAPAHPPKPRADDRLYDFVVNVVPFSFTDFIDRIEATCSRPADLQSKRVGPKILELPYTFDDKTKAPQTVFFLIHLKKDFHPPIQVRATIPLRVMHHVKMGKELVFYGLTNEAKLTYFTPAQIELDRQAQAARQPRVDSFSVESSSESDTDTETSALDPSSSAAFKGANQAAEHSGPVVGPASAPTTAFAPRPIPYPPSSHPSASRRLRRNAASHSSTKPSSIHKTATTTPGARSPLYNEVRQSEHETDDEGYAARGTNSRQPRAKASQGITLPTKPKRAAATPKPIHRKKPKAKAPEPSPMNLVKKKMVRKAAAKAESLFSLGTAKRSGPQSRASTGGGSHSAGIDSAKAPGGAAADVDELAPKPLLRRKTHTSTVDTSGSSKRTDPFSPPRNATRPKVSQSANVNTARAPVSMSKRSGGGSVVKPSQQASRVASASANDFPVSQRPPAPTGPHSNDGVGLARRTLSDILGIASADKQVASLGPVATATFTTSTSVSRQQANPMLDVLHKPAAATTTTRVIESQDGSRPILIRTVSSPATLSVNSATNPVRLLGSSAQVADIRRVLHAKLGTLSPADVLELTKYLHEGSLAKRARDGQDRQVPHYDPAGNALVMDVLAMPADVVMSVWKFAQSKGFGW